MSSFSFPMLKNAEILQVFRDLGVDVSLEQLKKPEAVVQRHILDAFVHFITGETREALRQPNFGALDAFQFPELHEESIVEVGMMQRYLRLVRAAGVDDVSFADFLQPTFKRNRQIFSALINFCKFKEERLASFQAFQDRSSELQERVQQLEHQEAQRRAQAEELQAQREQHLPEIEALGLETEALAENIAGMNQRQAEIGAELKAAKGAVQETDDAVKSARFMALNARQENERLESQVVKSPEKLKQSIADMGDELVAEKAELQALATKVRELQSRLDLYAGTCEKLEKRATNLDEFGEGQRRLKELQKSSRARMSEVDENQEAVRELTAEEQRLRKLLNTGRDNLFRLQRQFEERKHKAQLALDEVENERAAAARRNQQERQETEAKEAMARHRREELERRSAEHSADMAALRERYSGLAGDLRSYHTRLLDLMSTVA